MANDTNTVIYQLTGPYPGLGPWAGTLKTRDWKTRDQIAWVEKAGLENAGPNRMGRNRVTGKRGTKFSRVEKAGPPSMERETDKYRCTAFIETLSNIILYATTMYCNRHRHCL